MVDALVRYDVDRAIATITLDSPANRNALSARLIEETTAHLDAAAADPAVRAVVLTHTGTTFCAGADLSELKGDGGPAKGTARMVALLRHIVELPKPVVAVFDGNVRAGGLGLVGACDIALAGPTSSFAFTEVRIGVAPAIISLTTLPRINDRAAARYYLTGERFDAAEAARIGLITEAANDVANARDSVLDALRKAAPNALAEAKRMVSGDIRAAFDQRGEAMQELSAQLFASEEGREGITSFLEKRPPRWAETS